MKIAVMAERPDKDAFVPPCYEESNAMLIFETDTWQVEETITGRDRAQYYAALIRNDCEALVCGRRITKESFEPIAAAAITRYCGEGYPAAVAARWALENRLGYIVDYEGGTGCHSSERTCDGGCGAEPPDASCP